MKKNLISLVSVLALGLLAACGSDAAASAAGTYELDKEAMKAAVKKAGEGQDAPAAAMMEEVIDGMECTIQLRPDNTATVKTSMPGRSQEENGSWTLEGNKLSITAKDQDGNNDTKTGTLEDGKFRVIEDQGGQKVELVFVRKKS